MSEKPTYEELEQRILALEEAVRAPDRAAQALRESEARFRRLYNAMNEGMALHQLRYNAAGEAMDYVVLDVNPAYEVITGRKAEQVLGCTATCIYGTPEAPYLDIYAEVAATGRPAKFESEFPPMGKIFRVMAFSPARDQFATVFEDITERRRSEEAIKRSETLQRKLVANIADVVVIIDQDGINRYKSPNITRLFGWRPEEVVGASAWDNVHPEEVAATRQMFAKILREPDAVGTIECRYKCRDGGYRWIEFTGCNLLHDPDIRGLLGNYHDITERKRAEQSLYESETRFKALHNASFGGITIHDKGVILDCNQGLSEMTGYAVQELIGMDGMLLIAPQSRPMVMDHILSGYEKPYEAVGLRRNGEEFPIRLEARNIPYKGKMVRTVEFRDITENKRSEAEKARLQSQLNQAQRMESVGRLAGGVAHDFNNMLSVISGNTELAMDSVPPEGPLHDALQEVLKAARRSTDITRQLLAFARKQTIAPKVLDLNDTVEGMLKMLRRLIGEDIDLTWRPAASLWPVRMDPSQIDQVLANLCLNARDAIADVGRITIETAVATVDRAGCSDHVGVAPGDFVLLSVGDDGCGMDAAIMDNLFEPFFTTKDVDKGTGLGLATVYGIVRQNAGFIDVDSTPGMGTTFRIYLPRHAAAVDRACPTSPAAPHARGSETILLVEDEQAILEMTRLMLERLGYVVLTANKPGAAIGLAREYTGGIHMLMTDVVMPGMNGRDLARNLLPLFPDLKCLFMSGYTANVIAHHGVLDEGVQFIQKPFTRQELATRVREVLDEDSGFYGQSASAEAN